MQKQKGIQSANGGVDDLERFQAWAEGIKTIMSRANPYLYEVLGEIVSSQQPIGGGDILQTSQNIMRKNREHLECFKQRKSKLHRRKGSSAPAC